FRTVGSVPIQEDGDAVAAGPHPSEASPAVPAPRLADDLGSRGSRDVGGVVPRAVVDDDDAVLRREMAPQCRDQLTDRRLLVEARDDDPERSAVAGLHTHLVPGDCYVSMTGPQPTKASRMDSPHEHDRSSGNRSMRVRMSRRT